MRQWSRTTFDEYRRLNLRAHSLLADVPLHDVWQVKLPGGGRSRSMKDVRFVFETVRKSRSLGLTVRMLFAFRWALGRLFRWDRPVELEAWTFRNRLTGEDRRRSLVEPGTLDGPFSVLYVHQMEAVSETRNATVQAYLVWALEPLPDGYQLFWGIHVLPVNAWTRPYLALIDPFRRWLVYPSLLRLIHEAWSREFDSAP